MADKRPITPVRTSHLTWMFPVTDRVRGWGKIVEYDGITIKSVGAPELVISCGDIELFVGGVESSYDREEIKFPDARTEIRCMEAITKANNMLESDESGGPL